MRCVIAIAIAMLVNLTTASAAPSRVTEFTSADMVLRWINGYRLAPDVASVPPAVRALGRFGAFKDPETSGVYIGFIAGVLNANPARADDLVEKMLVLPPENHWVIVRAIVYSGLPRWKEMLLTIKERMPTRGAMIERYYAGKLPTLDQVSRDTDPTFIEKVKRHFGKKPPKEVAIEPSPELLDTYWGFYFATAAYAPISRIIAMLRWSKDKDYVDRLTLGAMAKYTLASNATKDQGLLSMLKWASVHQPQNVKPALDEVIEAAETMEIARIRKEAMASIDDLKRKGPGYKRDISTWGAVGEGAIGLGCVAAAATGQIALGLPCVLGGAATSAAVRFWSGQ
ncbi:MAG: hypothetical protein HY659_03430 [Rhizobiales bacterium]|nr:hypothetical protein [Hyphomicrobiales bacterium]